MPVEYYGSSITTAAQTFIVHMIKSFLNDVSYTPPISDSLRRQALIAALSEALQSWNIAKTVSHMMPTQTRIVNHSAAMAELSYHDHDFESQLQIAKFTWSARAAFHLNHGLIWYRFMIYMDDLSCYMPSALQDFQSKILRCESLEDPVLEHFRGHMSDMYQFWDTLPANCINCATFEFVNGCALECHPNIQNIKPCSSSASWPYFLRAKTGVAAAYAFMIFRKSLHPDMSHYMQVIADICLFIDLTNDVLSFYKEELAGETNNYIHNRSTVSGTPLAKVLLEVAAEATAAHNRVSETLQACRTSGCCNAWETFVNGYIAFHMTQDRYRLNELSLVPMASKQIVGDINNSDITVA